ncbi:MAG TPA: NlpC/P60 family protein [Sediminibacterium sp.]|nr:NlpC/P60 family protein [Sediminibacterium sp.]
MFLSRIRLIGWLALFAGISSCRTLRKLGNHDSASTTARVQHTRSTSEREFIDNIEVTPGGMVAQPENLAASRKNARKPVADKRKEAVAGNAIENASALQLKYSLLTDAPVEKLTNLPLWQEIDKWWGTRYCLGGNTDNCIDCSAFTQVLMKDVYQVDLPRTAQEQYDAAQKIDLEQMKEGDLVFFNTSGKDISHVGIYLLNNKFVHAATSGGVMISDLTDSYWQPRFRGAGRMGQLRGNGP